MVLRSPRPYAGVLCLPLEATCLSWAYLLLLLNKCLRICQWQSGELRQLLTHSLTHSFGDISWVSSNVPGTMLHTGDKMVTEIPSLSPRDSQSNGRSSRDHVNTGSVIVEAAPGSGVGAYLRT